MTQSEAWQRQVNQAIFEVVQEQNALIGTLLHLLASKGVIANEEVLELLPTVRQQHGDVMKKILAYRTQQN